MKKPATKQKQTPAAAPNVQGEILAALSRIEKKLTKIEKNMQQPQPQTIPGTLRDARPDIDAAASGGPTPVTQPPAGTS